MALLKETTVTTSQNGYSLILRTYEDAVNEAANTSTVRIEPAAQIEQRAVC